MAKDSIEIKKSDLENLLDRIDKQICEQSPGSISVKGFFYKREKGVTKYPFEFVDKKEDRETAYNSLQQKLNLFHNITLSEQDQVLLNRFKDEVFTEEKTQTPGIWGRIKKLVGWAKSDQYQVVDSNAAPQTESWGSWIGSKLKSFMSIFSTKEEKERTSSTFSHNNPLKKIVSSDSEEKTRTTSTIEGVNPLSNQQKKSDYPRPELPQQVLAEASQAVGSNQAVLTSVNNQSSFRGIPIDQTGKKVGEHTL